MTGHSDSGFYIGMRTSERLDADTAAFIMNIRDGVREDQNALLVAVMERFADEAVEGLVIGMCDAVGLRGNGRKVVNVTVSTIRTTLHLLSRRVLRGMKNGEVRDLAEHMDDLRMVKPDGKGGHVSYTAIPISAGLHRDIVQLHANIHGESPQLHVGAARDMLYQLMDAVIEHLYVRTLATIRLGTISRKLVEMAYKTVHSGAHGLISRVVPTLSDQELRDASAFCVGLVVSGEGAIDTRTGTRRGGVSA